MCSEHFFDRNVELLVAYKNTALYNFLLGRVLEGQTAGKKTGLLKCWVNGVKTEGVIKIWSDFRQTGIKIHCTDRV